MSLKLRWLPILLILRVSATNIQNLKKVSYRFLKGGLVVNNQAKRTRGIWFLVVLAPYISSILYGKNQLISKTWISVWINVLKSYAPTYYRLEALAHRGMTAHPKPSWFTCQHVNVTLEPPAACDNILDYFFPDMLVMLAMCHSN